MSTSSSSPLPFLPTEVKKEILKFCDQPTLAKTSGLSLEFLQLSSPLLYRHIVFKGPEGLSKFFTLVAEKRHPELEPWLDLSLVHSVTYIDVERSPFNRLFKRAYDPSVLPARRLHLPSSPTPGRLALHSLKVVLLAPRSGSRLCSFFDPVKFQLEGVGGGENSCLGVDLSHWTRLRRLVFVDAFFRDPLLSLNGRIPGPIKAYGLRILYHFTEPIHDVLMWIKDDLNVRGDESVEESVSQLQDVVIHGLIEEERKELLGRLGDSLLLPRITVVVESSPEVSTATDVSST
ncbi:hypothetical protein BDY24DRAFT_267761 [Mrakia frigida]|uniref:uncharacterized protein n=1 Tax=Mrakia frigida TaxID=29902 RepID=UPI003FCC0340